jgi:ABC-2 type transport system ATP-binding protein
VTVLVSTHYLEEAHSVCDRVAIIDQGKIIALDTPSRMIADLGQHVLDLGVGDDPGPVLAVLRQALPGLGEPMRTGSAVSVPSSLPAPELTELASRLNLAAAGATTISIRPATLNDVFLHLTSAARAREEAAA